MRTRKNFISRVLLAIFVHTFVACSSLEKICAAYSKVIRESSAVLPG